MPAPLTPSIVVRLNRLFTKHNWPHGGNSDDPALRPLFEQYCELLALLDVDEQELMLALLDGFQYFGQSAYASLTETALNALPDSLFQQDEPIYFVPCLAPSGSRAVKSPQVVLYTIRSQVHWHKRIMASPQHFPDRLEDLRLAPATTRVPCSIVLVDDYIGTGETAIAAIEQLRKYAGAAATDRVHVLSLVALERGVREIQSLGVPIVAAHVRRRGISDSATISNPAFALQVMEGIERLLDVGSMNSLGFLKSEGLEAMIRTPDNTFPVFWCRAMKDGRTWPAPFPRYES